MSMQMKCPIWKGDAKNGKVCGRVATFYVQGTGMCAKCVRNFRMSLGSRVDNRSSGR